MPIWTTKFNFYPRPPRGGRPVLPSPARGEVEISIHALLAEGDRHRIQVQLRQLPISIHALLAEGDRHLRVLQAQDQTISIHALLAEGDGYMSLAGWDVNDFYPRPPRGGRQFFQSNAPATIKISIHALLAEGDGAVHRSDHGQLPISIHALLAEGDTGSIALTS